MVVHRLALGNQRQLNGGDFSTLTDELWPVSDRCRRWRTTCSWDYICRESVTGEGRGFRVVWLLEEMGLAYRLRPVDLLAGVENDPEFLAVNPAGFIPAIQDGEVTMVESIAIMEYLMARYGPTPLAPDPLDPSCRHFQLIEIYDSSKSFDEHIQAPHTVAFRNTIRPLVGAPYDERRYSVSFHQGL